MDRNYTSLKDLDVYVEALKFRQMIMRFCNSIPVNEKFMLIDQLKRSSRSVTANIAEGYGRFHHNDNIKFCLYSRGSLIEILDHFSVAIEEGYLTTEEFEPFRIQYEIVLKLLNGYISYLKKKT